MRIHRKAALLLLCSSMAIASATHAQCPPQGQTVRSLQELQAARFAVDAAQSRNRLALALLDCLGHPNPVYIYGEPGRLARPALLIAQRKTLQVADWTSWLEKISQAPAGSSWAEGFKSQSALAQRHNVSSFLHALLAGSHAIQDPALTAQVLEQLAKL